VCVSVILCVGGWVFGGAGYQNTCNCLYVCTVEYVSDTVIEKAYVAILVRRVILKVILAVTLESNISSNSDSYYQLN